MVVKLGKGIIVACQRERKKEGFIVCRRTIGGGRRNCEEFQPEGVGVRFRNDLQQGQMTEEIC